MSKDITVQISDISPCPFQKINKHWMGSCFAPGESRGSRCDFGRAVDVKPPDDCPFRKGRIILEWKPEE